MAHALLPDQLCITMFRQKRGPRNWLPGAAGLLADEEKHIQSNTILTSTVTATTDQTMLASFELMAHSRPLANQMQGICFVCCCC